MPAAVLNRAPLLRPKPVALGGWVRRWREDFDGSLASLLRTGGPTEGGYGDGSGLLATNLWYGEYDERGTGGNDAEFWIRPQWAALSAGNWPISKPSSSILRLSAMPRPAELDGLLPVNPATGSEYANIAGLVHTRPSAKFKVPMLIRCRAKMPSGTGAWGAPCWENTIGPVARDQTRIRSEVDVAEWVNAASSILTAAFNWDTTPGGAFTHDPGNANVFQDLRLDFHIYEALLLEDRVIWFFDRKPIRHRMVPAGISYRDAWHYIIASMSVGGAGSFAGTYPGGAPVYTDIDWIEVWQPKSAAYKLTIAGENLGADLVLGYPVEGGTDPWYWGDQSSTFTEGAEVDDLPTCIVASGGADWHGRQGYGHGSSQVANGLTYRARARLNFGTSGKAYIRLETLTPGNTVDLNITSGGAISVTGGAVTNASIVQVENHKLFSCDWAPGVTADVGLRCGPYSNTAGQTVLLHDMELRAYP